MANSKQRKSNKENFTYPIHTQQMQLTCKVIQKIPPFLHLLTFQVYPPFLAEKNGTPNVTQFLEGPTTPPSLFNKAGQGVPTMHTTYLLYYSWALTFQQKLFYLF